VTCLAEGQHETGVWSATINVNGETKASVKNGTKTETVIVPGGTQEQSAGLVSLAIPFCEEYEGSKFKPIVFYKPQTEVPLVSKAPCFGNGNEPEAEPGYICVYRSEEQFGSSETEDQNAKFFGFQAAAGENTASGETQGGSGGRIGELAIFRTNEFNGAGTPLVIKKESELVAGGSWAVTAP